MVHSKMLLFINFIIGVDIFLRMDIKFSCKYVIPLKIVDIHAQNFIKKEGLYLSYHVTYMFFLWKLFNLQGENR